MAYSVNEWAFVQYSSIDLRSIVYIARVPTSVRALLLTAQVSTELTLEYAIFHSARNVQSVRVVCYGCHTVADRRGKDKSNDCGSRGLCRSIPG